MSRTPTEGASTLSILIGDLKKLFQAPYFTRSEDFGNCELGINRGGKSVEKNSEEIHQKLTIKNKRNYKRVFPFCFKSVLKKSEDIPRILEERHFHSQQSASEVEDISQRLAELPSHLQGTLQGALKVKDTCRRLEERLFLLQQSASVDEDTYLLLHVKHSASNLVELLLHLKQSASKLILYFLILYCLLYIINHGYLKLSSVATEIIRIHMVILLSNDVESNPGPIFDRSFQYIKDYLNDKDYDSNTLKKHIDTLLALQSHGKNIPKQYLTDENIVMWPKVKYKAHKDGSFGEEFCQKVYRIWSYWEDQACSLEFPDVEFPSKSTEQTTNPEKVSDTQNFSIKLLDEHKYHYGFFEYQKNKNNEFICLVENCNKGKKPMKNRETLRNHARRDHSIEIDLMKKTCFKTEPYKCECGKTFMKKQTLKLHKQKCQELERQRTASASISQRHGSIDDDAALPLLQQTGQFFAGNFSNSYEVDNGRPAASFTLVPSSINTQPFIPGNPTTFGGDLSTVNLMDLDDHGRVGATCTSDPFISNNHIGQGNQTALTQPPMSGQELIQSLWELTNSSTTDAK